MSISNYNNYKSSLSTMETQKSTAAQGGLSKSGDEMGMCIVDAESKNIWFIEVTKVVETNGDVSYSGPCIHLYFEKPGVGDATSVIASINTWNGQVYTLYSRCPWLYSSKLRKIEMYGDFSGAVPFTLQKSIKNGTLTPVDDNTLCAFDPGTAKKIAVLPSIIPNKLSVQLFFQANGAASILSTGEAAI